MFVGVYIWQGTAPEKLIVESNISEVKEAIGKEYSSLFSDEDDCAIYNSGTGEKVAYLEVDYNAEEDEIIANWIDLI